MMLEKKIIAYMTFRDGEPLNASSLFEPKYNVYEKKAPIWQQGDKSMKVKIIYKILNK